MFVHNINDADFIGVLGALPSSPAMTRAHILDAFGVLVTGDDSMGWWNALTRDRGEEGAAKAVAQLIISKGGKRVLALIKAEAAGRSIVARADDPKLARLLFDDSLEEFLYDQWELRSIVCEYYEETQVVLEDDDLDLPEPGRRVRSGRLGRRRRGRGEWSQYLRPVLRQATGERTTGGQVGIGTRSTPAERHFSPFRIDERRGTWREFLWANWESIDFVFDRPIYLVGKQERLSESTSDRVDLLAKGKSGEHLAIELKIVEARRGDYTQLVSYMGNMESSGVPSDKVRGILVAPAFSHKVLNSTAIEPRITLLRFNGDTTPDRAGLEPGASLVRLWSRRPDGAAERPPPILERQAISLARTTSRNLTPLAGRGRSGPPGRRLYERKERRNYGIIVQAA